MLEMLYKCGAKLIKCTVDEKGATGWIFSLRKPPREVQTSFETKELEGFWRRIPLRVYVWVKRYLKQ